jgi:DNA-binding transcriptional LysR family regulator
MSDRLSALRLFARVARRGNFSRAGKDLGLSQASVSRIVATLEREIGAALLTRTTRAVTLTEAGADYLARIEPILAALEEADQAARGGGALRGILRVALSTSFGAREVVPRLPPFLERHPSLRLNLLMSDQRHELVQEGVDIAIRLGALTDSTATARLIGSARRVLVASPSYVMRAGTPKTPADLASHALIIGPPGPSEAWTFQRDGRTVSIRAEGRLNVTANEGAVAAAVAGLGITSTSSWGSLVELKRGGLVEVLKDWTRQPVEAHAVFPAGRAAKPAARALADYLAQALNE